MPGVDASIPLSVKRPDITGKLSDLLDVQRKSIDIGRAQAETAGAQQTQKQRAATAKLFSEFDWQKVTGDDGTIDLNKIVDAGLLQAAGDSAPDVLKSVAGLKQQQLSNITALAQLRDTQQNTLKTMLGAFRSDEDVARDTPAGRQKIDEAISQYGQVFGKDAAPVVTAFTAALKNAPQGKLAQVLQNLQLQATSASDQASRQAPQYTQTGQELKQTNVYAQEGQAPKGIPLSIAPGEQAALVTGADGNLYVQKRDTKGNILGQEPVKGAPRFEVGERQAFEQQANTNFENISRNRTAASLAPQQLDQIHKAKELAKQVDTGKWSAQRAGVESGLASLIPGLGAAQSDATKLQELDKFLERISSDATRVLGTSGNTDAARESISRQNASIGYTPQAIQAVLNYAEAQTTAMQAKGDAQEQWLKKEGSGITKHHEFETAWRQAYDPVLFQLEVADGDEAKKIAGKLSKEQKATLRDKRKKLIELGGLKPGAAP